MLRVARHGLVVGFPYGKESARFDARTLKEELARGEPMNWRQEHVHYGLPDDETHLRMLELAHRLRPDLSIQWVSQEGLIGLRLRTKLQRVVSKDSRLYGLVFVPLYWLHTRGWRPRGYRRIYFLMPLKA